MQFAIPLDARSGPLLGKVDRKGDLAHAQERLSPTDSGELGIVNLDVLGVVAFTAARAKKPGTKNRCLSVFDRRSTTASGCCLTARMSSLGQNEWNGWTDSMTSRSASRTRPSGGRSPATSSPKHHDRSTANRRPSRGLERKRLRHHPRVPMAKANRHPEVAVVDRDEPRVREGFRRVPLRPCQPHPPPLEHKGAGLSSAKRRL